MDIAKVIRENRPNVTDSTIKTYTSVLRSIFKNAYHKDKEMSLEKFKHNAAIHEHLMEFPVATRKTKLAALVVLTGDPEYSRMMADDRKEVDENNMKQKKNDKQEEGMISMDEVAEIYKDADANARVYLMKKKMDTLDLMQIQKWILLSLTTGLFIAPRRSADWMMKWRNYDEEKDNYVDIKNGNFVFNHFKTVKIYGKQIVEIPKGLKVNLNKWFKVNPTDYVLFDKDMKPLTSSQVTHKLNDIFKKNISTSMLRHIFLTHKFGNVNLQEIADVAQAMGTSGDEALQYVKR